MEKKCSSCQVVKELSLFVVDRSSVDGFARVCKQCKNEFYLTNKVKISERRKKFREENKEIISEKMKEKRKTREGRIMLVMQHVRQRCDNPNGKRYHRYGGRGIKNLLTYDDINFLWDRDNASELKNPSIDRINNDGNYVLDNCQFIEWSHNSSKDVHKRSVNQIDLLGNIVKTWISLAEAGRSGFHPQNIMKCCQGKRPSHKGFKWSYV